MEAPRKRWVMRENGVHIPIQEVILHKNQKELTYFIVQILPISFVIFITANGLRNLNPFINIIYRHFKKKLVKQE